MKNPLPLDRGQIINNLKESPLGLSKSNLWKEEIFAKKKIQSRTK